MKRILLAATAVAFCVPTFAQTNVGVSVSVNQPGVYGRIDIGNVPTPPVLVYRQPVIIAPPQQVVVQQQPIYLHVPPGHAKNWRKHCGKYNACGQPVYFVRDEWVRERYQKEHPGRHLGHDKDDHKSKAHGPKGKAKGHDK